MSTAAALQFASQYVSRHRGQSLLLALALGMVAALPPCVRVFVRALEAEMRQRAAATPQVVGSKGSALDLMLAALHFRQHHLDPVRAGILDEVRSTGYADAIPLHVRFRCQDSPLVGTEVDYFSFRKLRIAQGRMFGRLGDCVLGAHAARDRGLKPGDHLFSSPEQVFDLAGAYPLKMRITGVLAEAGSPDDQAVFVDLKTAWLIDGRSHGHDDLSKPAAAANVLAKDSANVTGNAAVRMYQEVTDGNIGGFHFHGDAAEHPITAAIILPHDAKAEAILAGRYRGAKQPVQLIRPIEELESLLGALFRIEGAVVAGLLAAGAAALAVSAIVFALSFKLRSREFSTLGEIGISSSALFWVKVFEIALVGLAASLVAAAAVMLCRFAAPGLITWGLR